MTRSYATPSAQKPLRAAKPHGRRTARSAYANSCTDRPERRWVRIPTGRPASSGARHARLRRSEATWTTAPLSISSVISTAPGRSPPPQPLVDAEQPLEDARPLLRLRHRDRRVAVGGTDDLQREGEAPDEGGDVGPHEGAAVPLQQLCGVSIRPSVPGCCDGHGKRRHHPRIVPLAVRLRIVRAGC